MPKISVIIPVYNVEKYLPECIESILSQSFTDYEVILINDGSTDSSGEICDFFSQKDSRIKVFHTHNQGVSVARNLGLTLATGVWITFIDADDSIAPYYFDILSNRQQDPKVDLIIVDYKKHNDNNGYYKTGDSKSLSKGRISNLTTINTSCWAYFFLREIIEIYQIGFPTDIKYGEDQVFLFKYLTIAQTYYLIQNTYYIYRVHSESAMAQPYNSHRAFNHLDAILDILEFQQQNSVTGQIPGIISKGMENLNKGFWYIQLRCINTKKEFKSTLNFYKQFERKASVLLNTKVTLSFWKYILIVIYFNYIKLKKWLVF